MAKNTVTPQRRPEPPGLYESVAVNFNRMDRQLDCLLYGISQGRMQSALRAAKAMRATLAVAIAKIELEVANG